MKINKVRWADNKEYLKNYDDNTFDSIVTDPPYGIKFMNKKWDYQIPDVELWQECLRVLKPGGHILVACGTRTQHRMTVNIEDAGFEIKNMVGWMYGQGFPKNYDIGKAVDKIQGNEREFIGYKKLNRRDKKVYTPKTETSFVSDTKGINPKGLKGQELTKGNSQWEGWGTALKPAFEAWTLARKPLSEKTIVDNVLKWGTGGINIDGCRIPINAEQELDKRIDGKDGQKGASGNPFSSGNNDGSISTYKPEGRFPADLIHDGSEEVLRLFPKTKSGKSNGSAKKGESGNITPMRRGELISRNDDGSAARFFYCAKASKRERGEYNDHATVKPISLMRYLVRLITPKGGIVLDPFCGSGSTLIAAKLEGFQYIGIDNDKKSVKIAKRRLDEHEQTF